MKTELKDIVTKESRVSFVKFQSGNLWYMVTGPDHPNGQYSTYAELLFEFPVPVEDTGDAVFLAEDKSILFMRWIRKHLQFIKESQGKEDNENTH